MLKQRKGNKFTTKYELEPYTIIEHKGTKIVAENQNHTVTRNASFFKTIKGGVAELDGDDYRANVSTRAEINKDVETQVLGRSTRDARTEHILEIPPSSPLLNLAIYL